MDVRPSVRPFGPVPFLFDIFSCPVRCVLWISFKLCVCTCVCVCVCERERVCVCACMGVRVCVSIRAAGAHARALILALVMNCQPLACLVKISADDILIFFSVFL